LRNRLLVSPWRFSDSSCSQFIADFSYLEIQKYILF
jgi:hypothetical protein